MNISNTEHIHESFVESIRGAKGRKEGMKILMRRSIFKIIQRAKGSKYSYEIKKQIEGINKLETLEAILAEIWNAKEMNMIDATIKKYDWLKEIEQLDMECYGRIR